MRREVRFGLHAACDAKSDQSEASEDHTIEEFQQQEPAALLCDDDIGPRQRQQFLTLNIHQPLGQNNRSNPKTGFDCSCPEHRSDGKDNAKRRHGEWCADFVAGEHGQEFVFVLRLNVAALGQPLPIDPEIIGFFGAARALGTALRHVGGIDIVVHCCSRYPNKTHHAGHGMVPFG